VSVIAQIRSAPFTSHLGTGILSCLGAYIGVLGIRFIVDLSPWVLATAGAEMLVWYAGLHLFKDWSQFKGLAPISILATLGGTWLGIIIP